MRLLLVGMVLWIAGEAVWAQQRLKFVLSDGSEFTGTLSGGSDDRGLRVACDVFADEWAIPTDVLLSASSDPLADPKPREGSVAVELADQSRFVGRWIGPGTGAPLRLQTATLGVVEIDPDKVRSLRPAATVKARLHSMQVSPWRWSRAEGWSHAGEGRLVSMRGEATVAGDFAIPARFRLRLAVRCDGEAHFQLLLGDRTQDLAGQGRGVRNGPRSIAPSARYVTRMEWIGDSLSLLRSDASVADHSVFAAPVEDGVLQLDLYVNQDSGSIAAFHRGNPLGEASLRDDGPLVTESITLTNRGDPAAVQSLELYQWDGAPPPSIRMADRMSGDDRDSQRWTEFRVATQPYPLGAVEFLLADGSRIAGSVLASDTQRILVQGLPDKVYPIRPETIGRPPAAVYRIQPEDVVRVLAARSGKTDAMGDRLQSEEVRIHGRLADEMKDQRFQWTSPLFSEVVPLNHEMPFEIVRDVVSNTGQAAAHRLRLANGDVLAGELIAGADDAVRFRGAVCGEVSVPASRILALEVNAAETAEALPQTVMTLPRRQANDPPTHLMIARTGDMLRGRVTALNATETRIEVRGRVRSVPTERISKIIWLPSDGKRDEPETDWKVHVTTVGGDRIGLGSTSFDGETISGRHEDFGDCRIPFAGVTRLRLGGAVIENDTLYRLIPAKRPRTFEE